MPKIVFFLLFLIFLMFSLFQLSKSRTFQFFGGITSRVQTTQKVVALTFDDAPSEYSSQVVDILTSKDIPATFYAIGQNIQRYPQEAKYIADHGHEFGNHSYSHQRFLFKSPSFIDSEIQRTNQLIANLGYKGSITFRPPNGKKLFLLPWYLFQHQIKTITWDIEPDSYVSSSTAIVNYVQKQITPGSIILLHPFCNNCSADRQALPQIIDNLKADGYQFVTVSQLLQLSH